jgi:hypothetical protein
MIIEYLLSFGFKEVKKGGFGGALIDYRRDLG